MKRYYCTFFDRNYLIKGLALIESLNRHENNEFLIFTICLDEITREILNKLDLKNIQIIPFHEIEQKDPPLITAKQNRSLVEYYRTITPTVILKILENHPQIPLLTFLDADLFFYSSADPIFEEFGDQAVLIYEHHYSPPLTYLENFGKYNVGLLIFRNNTMGVEALTWWREHCLEWCHIRLEDGKYGNQLYLNDWPMRFRGVVVLQNRGGGVSPWNHERYRYSTDESGNTLVNGEPLIFYHFNGLCFAHPQVIVPARHYQPLTQEIIHLIFLPYIRSLSQGIEAVESIIPDFSFGLSDENVLTTAHTFIAKKSFTPIIASSEAPQLQIELDDDWDCFCSSQLKEFPFESEKLKNTTDFRDLKKIGFIHLINEQSKHQALQDSISLNQQGEKLFNKNDMEGALAAFRKAIEIDAACATAHNNLGVLYCQTGALAEAIAHFMKALEIDPTDRDTILNCAELLKNLEKFEDARDIYLSYLQKHPDDEEVEKALTELEDMFSLAESSV